MAIRRNACSRLALPDLPEFAQAGRYGVPGTPPWCTRNSTHAEGPITISGRSNAEEDTAIALGKQLISIPDMVHQSRRYPLGIYRGLNFGLVLHPQGAPETYLEGTATRHGQLSSDAGARAVLNALDRLTGGYKAQAATARLPAAHEIADRINTLKAAHSIEPAPQRPATPHTAAAEDPVIARSAAGSTCQPPTSQRSSPSVPHPRRLLSLSSFASTRPCPLRPSPNPLTKIVSPATIRGKHAR